MTMDGNGKHLSLVSPTVVSGDKGTAAVATQQGERPVHFNPSFQYPSFSSVLSSSWIFLVAASILCMLPTLPSALPCPFLAERTPNLTVLAGAITDCRGMVKTLVSGMKTIVWGAGSCKLAGSSE